MDTTLAGNGYCPSPSPTENIYNPYRGKVTAPIGEYINALTQLSTIYHSTTTKACQLYSYI